jgi:hypothetical protein
MNKRHPPIARYFGWTETLRSNFPTGKREPPANEEGVDPVFLAAAVADRNFATDIDTAAKRTASTLFHGWPEKVQGDLNDAYPPFLHMLNGGEVAVEQVLHHPLFPRLQRRHRSNPALAEARDELQHRVRVLRTGDNKQDAKVADLRTTSGERSGVRASTPNRRTRQ